MEINLLPKRSPVEEYRFLIFTVPIFVVLAGAVYGFVLFEHTQSEISLLQSDLYHVQSDKVVLRAERNVDSKTKLYQELQSSVQAVQQQEHRHGQMLDRIAAQLSDKTRVTKATMDADKQLLTLEMQSDSVDNIADYAALLRKEPWVQDVFVQNIKNTVDDSNPQQAQAKTKTAIPFTTKVEITLAPNEIPVGQPAATTKK